MWSIIPITDMFLFLNYYSNYDVGEIILLIKINV